MKPWHELSCAVQQYQGAEKAYRRIPKPAAPLKIDVEVHRLRRAARHCGTAWHHALTSSAGARTSRRARSLPPASAASSRRSRPYSTISVSITPWSATQLMGQAIDGEWKRGIDASPG